MPRAKNANTPVWTTLMLGWNQETMDPRTGALLTDNDAAVAAASLYAKLGREFGPPDLAGFNWNG